MCNETIPVLQDTSLINTTHTQTSKNLTHQQKWLNIQAFSKQQTVHVRTNDFSRSGPDLSLLKAFSTTLQIHGLCLYTALSDCLYSVVLGVHFQKQFFLLCKSTICLLQKTEKLQGAKNGRENYHISTFLKKNHLLTDTISSSVFLKFLTLNFKC